jgi:hypothetical protein
MTTPRLAAITALFATLLGAPGCMRLSLPASPPRPPPSAGMATWVWDEGTVLDARARHELLAFARANRVNALFVQAAPGYEEDAGFEALAALVAASSAQGASVTLVGGDPSWSLPSHHGDALALVQRARRIGARLAARALPPGGRVLFDVEPYLLPEWHASPATTAAAYADLLRVLGDAGRAAALDVWHTIPFWFPQYGVGGRPLDGLVLERSAGVVVMAYRNRAADVASLAAPILEQAARLRRPVIVAVETTCVDPPHVSFCGQTAGDLADALDRIGLALQVSPAFAGLAVHKYASWVTLEGRAR